MTDSIARQQLPVPLAYRHAGRAQVLADLIHDLVYGGAPENALGTRSLSDPTVALLDAWATIADVIDFYQERIAAESYLTTATEPESVLALAALLGYRPRPGLAATCWLAYTLVPDPTDTAVLIPQHQLVQSIPGAGELPQTFETTDDLTARPSWNTLPVKTTRPPKILSDDANNPYQMPTQLTVAGALPPLSANDVVLIIPTQPSSSSSSDCLLLRAASVSSDVLTKTTTVTLQEAETHTVPTKSRQGQESLVVAMDNLITPLTMPLSTPPATAADIPKSATSAPATDPGTTLSDMSAKVLAVLHPELSNSLYPALASSTIGAPQINSVYALRATSAPFGVQIPPKPRFDSRGQALTPQDWPLNDNQTLRITLDISSQVTPLQLDAQAPNQDAVSPRTFSNASVRFDTSTYHDAVTITGSTATLSSSSGQIVLSGSNSDVLTLTFTTDLDNVTVTLSQDANGNQQVKVESPAATDSVIVGIDPTGNTTSAVSNALYVTVGVPPQFTPGAPTPTVIEVTTALAVSSDSLNVLQLNDRRDDIVPGSYVMIEGGSQLANATAIAPLNPQPLQISDTTYVLVTQVQTASPAVVNRYGMSMTVTQLTLKSNWLDATMRLLSQVRGLVVHALSVPLDLMDEPWCDPVSDNTIDVDGLYPGLETGQRLVITGTRADPGLSGATVQAGEAIMVAGVSAPNDASHTGQTPYTTLTLAAKLAYIYRRDTVTLYGNVVPAHHGPVITETPTATGDPAHPQFTLAQSPVLADPSPTQSGFVSSLVLVIDGRTWTWVSRFDDHTSARCYITGTDSQGRTTITLSEPLPHAASTVTASYRAGVGSAGNVRAGQLTQPLTRPLAVAKVTNPLPASGGSDPDGPDDVRTGAPRGLQALGRVVSVQDAADLALSWAGIGKATATLMSDSHTYILKVAVAGLSPTPLDGSTFLTDLSAALQAAGDITVPISVVPAQATLIVLRVRIRHDPDMAWNVIEPAVRAELTEAYGYDKRDINEDIVVSDLIAVIHRVDGVWSAAITGVGQIPYDSSASDIAALTLGPPDSSGRIQVQSTALPPDKAPVTPVPVVGYISATVSDTLILQEANDDHT
jgi:predicted phage baseplate assembly protein